MLRYELEPLMRVIPDMLKELSEKHYQELADTSVPLDVDYTEYFRLEGLGVYKMMAARDDGRLVGYMGYFLNAHPRYRSLRMAVADIFYLHPDYRKGRTGMKMIKAAEDILKGLGMNRVVNHVKIKNDFGKVFEHMGYTPLERTYIKKL